MNKIMAEDQGDLLEPDEEVAEQIEWEENLEHQFGGLTEDMAEKRTKAMGPGFSKQKQVMEENEYYRGDGKKKKIFVKHKK